ncbi:cell division protein FtsX [Peribacillus asahii]|uniref:cell division protein FtsX n=1 Tax=Peribacillus asahii TaxID=228899 RepID=UPI003828F396
MNPHAYKYIFRDAKEGLRRNAGASFAAVALIFVAMTMIGMLLLVRLTVTDVTTYLESQISMKVYIDPQVETEEVAAILEEKSFVESVEVETGQQLLDKLAFFFNGKEYLLDSFRDSEIEDAIRLDVTDKTQTVRIAKELEEMDGIVKVVYPQQLAEILVGWSEKVNQYGLVAAGFFFFMSFGMVYIAIHLALYQRQKEIRVKLLIGAKPSSVRQQFLFEGSLVGFMGSFLAVFGMYSLFSFVLLPIAERFPFIFSFSLETVYLILGGMMLLGVFIGIAASYLSTRKLIKDA